ncbi:hypothetical protein V6N13_011121 [Hibiscus sabdariffa]|uniref:SAM domain-containing protein n=1 Tax=Hibiscus sabdariffa TaxID=183260 RepID=A0ABR2SBF0_9ROSI
MDWFSWLSKTGLHPSLVYEYGLCFSHNELEEEDIVFFNHEFLQSMGISIAKHRLEILKLAAKNKGLITRWRLVLGIKRTKWSLAQYIRPFVHRQDSALLVANQRISSVIGSYGNKWKAGANAMLNRKKTIMLTNGTHPLVIPPGPDGEVESVLSPMVFEHRDEEETKMVGDDGDGVQEISWDAMFQDLNPT